MMAFSPQSRDLSFYAFISLTLKSAVSYVKKIRIPYVPWVSCPLTLTPTYKIHSLSDPIR